MEDSPPNTFQMLLSKLKSPTEPNAPVSASDFVAGFQNNNTGHSVAEPVHEEPSATGESPQNYLLKLLKSQTVAPTSPSNVFSPLTGASPPPVPAPTSKPSPFTYSNPFDQLMKPQPAQSPAPPSARSTPQASGFPSRQASNLASFGSESKISNQGSQSSQQPVETVAEAVGEVGEEAEKQVEEALAKFNLEETMGDAKPATHTADQTLNGTDSPSPASQAESQAADWQEDDDDESANEPFVYNFPMKPFVSLSVVSEPDAALPLPTPTPDTLSYMVRSKKEFDQLDRNLVACTPHHIVYAHKEKGIRVIDGNTGRYEDMFNGKHGDHVYSVLTSLTTTTSDGQLKNSEPKSMEIAIATGANGGLFWTKLEPLGRRTPPRAFSFAPHAPEQDAAGPNSGLLKTRVKASNKHPQFFAYGRGKNIHFVWPSEASDPQFTNSSTDVCDSERYLASTNVRILAGKAAKDFAFSYDDTVIASLDKAGKLKLWDVSDIAASGVSQMGSVNHVVNTPMMVFNTTQPGEKSWPTSVMFVDKEKPMSKGYACRYMIIGMKQNHVIQIWDFALGKPVQEINFPHDDESDPMLSLAYCARSSTLAVGHPKRNSIFLLHVSYPPYRYTPVTQAKFIGVLARGEKKFPAPASTAIVDHIQEYSLSEFDDIGELRSFDLMVGKPSDAEDIPGYMATLICMHSKGIFRYILTKPNLGLGNDGSGHRTIDGIKAGIIATKDIVQPLQDDNVSVSTKTTHVDTPQSGEKDKKKKKKAESLVSNETPLRNSFPTTNPPSIASPSVAASVAKNSVQDPDLRGMVSEIIRAELAEFRTDLYNTRYQDQEFFRKVQADSYQHIERTMQGNLITWRRDLENAVDGAVKAHLEEFPRRADHDVQTQLLKLPARIQELLAPGLQAWSAQSATLVAKEVESRHHHSTARSDAKLQQQSEVIANINDHVTSLSRAHILKNEHDVKILDQITSQLNTVTAAVTTLAKMQSDSQAISRPGESPWGVASHQQQYLVREFQEMQDLINKDQFDNALVKWLASKNQSAAFDEVFTKYTSHVSRLLQNTNQLIVLSVVAATTVSLITSVPARLEWVDQALELIDIGNPEIRRLVPSILDLVISRMHELFESARQASGISGINHPLLPKIQKIGHRASELNRAVAVESIDYPQ